MSQPITTHGWRVIGKEAAEAQEATKAAGAHHFGPRVTGIYPPGESGVPAKAAKSVHGVAVNPPSTKGASPAATALSIEEIEATVRANGTHLETLLDAELARADGPRAAALQLFRTLELGGVNGGPHGDVLADIDEALAAVPAAPVAASVPSASSSAPAKAAAKKHGGTKATSKKSTKHKGK